MATDQRCTSHRQAFITIAAAWVLQTKLRVVGWDDCTSSGVANSLRALANCTAQLAPQSMLEHAV
eukprot:3673656-Pyramimonas_sp.AAC.1